MRVSDTSIYKQFLRNAESSRSAVAEALNRLADGKRVRVASDDPSGARKALDLRGQLVRLEGYTRSGDSARFDLSTVDNVLGEAVNLLIDVRSKAMAGASGTYSQANDVLATEIEQIRDQLLALANTEQKGRYLFGGTETLTRPFDAAGTYQGDGNEVQATIAPGLATGVTVPGQRVFQGGGDVFTTLSDLATALRNDDTAAVEALIPDLGAELDNINVVRTDVGTRLALIRRNQQQIDDDKLRVSIRISEIEDASLPETAVRLSSANTSLEALSQAASRTLGRSLFDFLG